MKTMNNFTQEELEIIATTMFQEYMNPELTEEESARIKIIISKLNKTIDEFQND